MRKIFYLGHIKIFIAVQCLLLLISACGIDSNTPVPISVIASPTPLEQSNLTFEVEIPLKSPQGQNIYLDILDEVTGLALNPVRVSMTSIDALHASIKIPLTLGSVVKYRYLREGNPPAFETTSLGKLVRYRMIVVSGQTFVKDSVSSWSDIPYQETSGRISGQVTNAVTNSSIPNILITAGGNQTLTSSDGSYLLEGLPPGTHNLVAYSLDGSYQPFQQGAVVAPDATTPAPLQMTPSVFVNITFLTRMPESSIKNVPVRMLGNIYQLGNTFADLTGGVSTIASRAPQMTPMQDGRYSLTLALPMGLDLRYKYSLGDGFWNSEHGSDGRFVVRQLIIPSRDSIIEDAVESWSADNNASISFSVRVPNFTPKNENISLQFNPYGWTEPLPMWSLGNDRWLYVLYSPFNMFSHAGYRYCRNDECGVTDDLVTKGFNTKGFPFTTSRIAQTFEDDIQKWNWLDPPGSPTTVVASDIQARGSTFMAGVELLSKYQPPWQSYMNIGIQKIQELGSNWVILTPTWRYTRNNPPVLEIVPGKDPLWMDLNQTVNLSQHQNLKIALFPQTIYDPDPSLWWQSAKKDSGWWQNWFERYRTFILHHADFASQNNLSALIIGGPDVLPALPGGLLDNGSPSNVPGDVDEKWRQLLRDIRTRFGGKLAWAMGYPNGFKQIPGFLSDLDFVYILWSAPLTTVSNPNMTDLANEFGRLLDTDILPFQASIDKPITIAIDYPSIDGAGMGCINAGNLCLPFNVFDQPFIDIPGVNIDLAEQTDIYNASLSAINQRPWITGIISRGFYPPAAVQDKSSSIHGKPASDVLWYWFPKILK